MTPASTTDPDHLLATADELGTELVRMMRLLTKASSQLARAQPHGIEQGTFAILGTLLRSGPQRTSALAELLHLEVSTVSRQTGTLVSHGFLHREADPADGRACVLAPTEEGTRVYQVARDARNRWLAATLRDWDDDERARLIDLLDRLATDLAEVPVLGPPGAHDASGADDRSGVADPTRAHDPTGTHDPTGAEDPPRPAPAPATHAASRPGQSS